MSDTYLSSKQRNKLKHALNGNMGAFGNLLGQGLGRLGGGFFGQGDLGQGIGGQLGSLLPFARGGRVMIIKPGPPQMKKGGRSKKKKGKKK